MFEVNSRKSFLPSSLIMVLWIIFSFTWVSLNMIFDFPDLQLILHQFSYDHPIYLIVRYQLTLFDFFFKRKSRILDEKVWNLFYCYSCQHSVSYLSYVQLLPRFFSESFKILVKNNRSVHWLSLSILSWVLTHSNQDGYFQANIRKIFLKEIFNSLHF